MGPLSHSGGTEEVNIKRLRMSQNGYRLRIVGNDRHPMAGFVPMIIQGTLRGNCPKRFKFNSESIMGPLSHSGGMEEVNIKRLRMSQNGYRLRIVGNGTFCTDVPTITVTKYVNLVRGTVRKYPEM